MEPLSTRRTVKYFSMFVSCGVTEQVVETSEGFPALVAPDNYNRIIMEYYVTLVSSHGYCFRVLTVE